MFGAMLLPVSPCSASGHPNIVEYIGGDDNCLIMVALSTTLSIDAHTRYSQEYCPGGSLKAAIELKTTQGKLFLQA